MGGRWFNCGRLCPFDPARTGDQRLCVLGHIPRPSAHRVRSSRSTGERRYRRHRNSWLARVGCYECNLGIISSNVDGNAKLCPLVASARA